MLVLEKDVEDIKKEIGNAEYVALDTETISLNEKTIVSFSFAIKNKVYFVPVRMKYFFNVSEKVAMDLLKYISEHKGVVFHHFAFDGLVLHEAGIDLQHAPHDTLIISHLLDENGSHKLKDLVQERLNYTMIRFKDICGTGKKQIEFRDVKDKEMAMKYASDDAEYTLRLFELLLNELNNNPNLKRAYEEVERPLLLVVNDMHIQGLPADASRVASIEKKCISLRDLYKRKLDHYMTGVNLDSPKQLKEYFIGKKGLRVIKRSKRTNEPSVDSDVLKKYAKMGVNEADWILKYRFYAKITSTFIPALKPDTEGKIHPFFHQVGTTSGRFSSSNPNCLSLDTEILTPEGWKKHNNLSIGDSVYQWEEGETVSVAKVLNKYEGVQEGVRYNNRHIDICASLNHRQVFKDRKTSEYKVKEMQYFMKDALIIHGGLLNSEKYNKEIMKFNVAVQADGHITKNYIDFGFTKKRKAERLLQILKSVGIKYKDRSTVNRFRYAVYGKEYLIYLTKDKKFSTKCIQLGTDFIEELFYWDGLFTRKNNYASSIEHNIDIVQAAAALTGKYRTHKRIYVSKGGSVSYQLDFTRKNYSGTSHSGKKSIGKITPIKNLNVWAISVPSSFIIARRNGKVFVTGNCQNLPRAKDDELEIRKCIKAPKGYKLVGYDYSAIELRLTAHFSNQNNLIDSFNKGTDMHAMVAKDVGCTRDQAKTLTYACVPLTAKALTRTGWKGYNDLKEGEDILAFNPETNLNEWTPCLKKVYYESAPVIQWKHGHGFEVESTPNHRWYGRKRKQRGHAETSFRYYDDVIFTTEEANIEYIIRRTAYAKSDSELNLNKILDKSVDDNKWVEYVLKMSESERYLWFSANIATDGYKDKRYDTYLFSQNYEHQPGLFDAMVVCGYLLGYNVYETKKGVNMKTVRFGKRQTTTMQNMQVINKGFKPVWCVQTKFGTWVMKQGNTITITGNTIYGAGINVIAKNMKTDRVHASQYIQAFRVKYQDITMFIQNTKQEIVNNNKIGMLYGRERHMPKYFEDLSEWEKGGVLRSMVNAKIQGSSAMMMKKAMVDIYNGIQKYDAHIVATIHDEIICLVKEDEAEEVAKVMDKAMTDSGKGLKVKITVDGGIGNNWMEIH